jgi:diacylglycerol kinase family enzyme
VRAAVLLNASAGSVGREGRDKLRAALEASFAKHAIVASLEFLNGADLRAGAESAVQRVKGGEFDVVVAGGGDGSIRTVAEVLSGSGVTLGLIPLGTLNHFAKDLCIPLGIEEAVAVIAAGETRAVDVGEVNGRIFINNSSIGIYPYLVVDRERQRRRHGLAKWPAMVVSVLRAIRYFPLRRLRIRADGLDKEIRSPCVFIGNNKYGLSGFSLGRRERLDEGQLCLLISQRQSVISLLGLACRSILGLIDQQRDLRNLAMPRLEVRSHHHRLLVALDGEVEIIRSPLRYQTRRGALCVLAPSVPT